MEELDIGSALAAEVETPAMVSQEASPDPVMPDGGETAPQIEPVQQAPQFDPAQMQEAMSAQSAQIENIAKQMGEMNSKVPEATQAQATEEEMLQAKIREDLGINKMEEQYKQQQDIMNQQKAQLDQMQQQEIARQRESEFKSLEAEYGNIDREVIQNKLAEIGKANPALADALNSPEGVKMLLAQGIGAVVKTPDPITPSANGGDVSNADASSRVMAGEGTEADFGDLLASYV